CLSMKSTMQTLLH
ncbi:bacterial type II/III secretion system short domain protein, partial [Chlamydia psittaci 06-1683]